MRDSAFAGGRSEHNPPAGDLVGVLVERCREVRDGLRDRAQAVGYAYRTGIAAPPG
jgi:hypothetical protein